MNHIKHLTHPLRNVNIVIYLLSLACSVLCLSGSSVYIPPTYSTEPPKPRIPGELYPRMIIMYMGKYKLNSDLVFRFHTQLNVIYFIAHLNNGNNNNSVYTT